MSRTQRTAQFNNIVEKLWTQKFWDFIKDYSDKELFWEGISKNPNITWDIIRDNSDKPWNWKYISYNPNITWDIIKENPDKP